MADEFTTDVTQWQGVDDEPTKNSHNLITSGGVENAIKDVSDTIPLVEFTNGKGFCNIKTDSTYMKNIGSIKPNGEENTAAGLSNFRYTDFLLIKDLDIIEFVSLAIVQDNFCAMVLYDKDKEAIQAFGGQERILLEDYPTAVYCRLSCSLSDTYSFFHILSFKNDRVIERTNSAVALSNTGTFLTASGYSGVSISPIYKISKGTTKIKYNVATQISTMCGLVLFDAELSVLGYFSDSGEVDLSLFPLAVYFQCSDFTSSTTFNVQEITEKDESFIELTTKKSVSDLVADGYLKLDGTIGSNTNIGVSDKISLKGITKIFYNCLLDTNQIFTGIVLYNDQNQVVFHPDAGKSIGIIYTKDYPTATYYKFCVGYTDTWELIEYRESGKENFGRTLTKNNILLYNWNGGLSDFAVTGWTVVDSKLQNSGVGLSNSLVLNKYYSLDGRSLVLDFTQENSAILYVYTKPSTEAAGGAMGSMISVDFSTNKMNIHAAGNMTSITSILKSTNISAASSYRLVMTYKERNIYLTLIDRADMSIIAEMNSEDLTVASDYSMASGQCYDYPSIFCSVGSVDISLLSVVTSSNIQSPIVYVVGDSITEGHGIPYNKGYAYLLRGIISNTIISGRRGGNIDGVLERAKSEAKMLLPNNAMITIGTNGGNTAFKLAKLCYELMDYCSNVILNTIPHYKADVVSVQTINNTILDVAKKLKLQCVRMDLALDGTDATLYVDDVHPSEAGAEKMLLQIKKDLPLLVQ